MFHIERGVVLVAEQIDPNTIGETFLRQHSIIQDDYVVAQTPILTPVLSQIVFRNGLSIVAEPSRLLIVHKGDDLDTDTNRCSEFAIKYLDCAPLPPFKAIGINFRSVVPRTDEDSEKLNMARFFKDHAQWLQFGDTTPDLSFKANYRGRDKTINLEVGPAQKQGDSSHIGLLHVVNFHRDLDFVDTTQTHSRLTTILSDWKHDLHEFEQIVSSLYKA